jgi:hypothetical protein
MRINMDWITAGTDWQNGSHGPNTTVTFPTPIEKRHWFWQESKAFRSKHRLLYGDWAGLSILSLHAQRRRSA